MASPTRFTFPIGLWETKPIQCFFALSKQTTTFWNPIFSATSIPPKRIISGKAFTLSIAGILKVPIQNLAGDFTENAKRQKGGIAALQEQIPIQRGLEVSKHDISQVHLFLS